LDELRQLVVRVQAARIGQQPHSSAFETLGLRADRSLLALEGMAISPDAKKSDYPWPVAPDFARQAPSPADEFLRRELVRRRRAAVDEVGDAVAAFQQFGLLRRGEFPLGKTCQMQGGPEAVAGPREVMAGGCGVKARVDADEKYF
jgi:hypothetical protein